MSTQCPFPILPVAGQELAAPPWDSVEVIRKPFDLDEVVRRVEAALPSAQANAVSLA